MNDSNLFGEIPGGVPEALINLGDQPLINHRVNRYQGDDLCSDILDFNEADQVRIRELYNMLLTLFNIVSEPAKAGVFSSELEPFLRSLDIEKLTGSVREIGSGPHYEKLGPLARTAHDIRGGSLTSLLYELDAGLFRLAQPELTRSLFLLSRDHLKIMRNALLGLDTAKRDADLLPVIHAASLITDKWDHAEIKLPDHSVTVSVQQAYQGPIAESCVEFGAIDRVLYNLMNNAARHAADRTIQLLVSPFPVVEEPEDLRFLIVNQVADSELAALHSKSRGENLGFLFEAGVSTTGSGLGMSIVSDFVSNAYGISGSQALQEHYFGASLRGKHFAAWFHWPITTKA